MFGTAMLTLLASMNAIELPSTATASTALGVETRRKPTPGTPSPARVRTLVAISPSRAGPRLRLPGTHGSALPPESIGRRRAFRARHAFDECKPSHPYDILGSCRMARPDRWHRVRIARP